MALSVGRVACGFSRGGVDRRSICVSYTFEETSYTPVQLSILFVEWLRWEICAKGASVLVGIMSDSHGDHIMVRRALSIFDDVSVAHIIHCGDVGGTPVFDELVGRPCSFVWGNTDPPAYGDNGMCAYLDSVGIKPPTEIPMRLTLDGKTFAVFHGHERGFNAAVESLDVDYILHGHTHETRDDRRGQTRIINAGALHRARVKTVATLDTSTDKLTSYPISSS